MLKLTIVVFCFRELSVIGLPEAKLWRELPVRVSSNSVNVLAAYPQMPYGLSKSAHVADSVVWSNLLNSQVYYIVIMNKTRCKACSI
jgi:hypothetical protein